MDVHLHKDIPAALQHTRKDSGENQQGQAKLLSLSLLRIMIKMSLFHSFAYEYFTVVFLQNLKHDLFPTFILTATLGRG